MQQYMHLSEKLEKYNVRRESKFIRYFDEKL